METELPEHMVAQDFLDSGYMVSTVKIDYPGLRMLDFLIEGLSPIAEKMGYSRPGMETKATEYKYETMVFKHQNEEVLDFEEVDCQRYQTEEEALMGHRELFMKWSKNDNH